MKKVFLDGKFFADWEGSLQELAAFAGVAASRLSYGLESAKADRLAQLNADFEAAIAALTKEWPESEMKTWTVQSDEARQWLAGPADDKPSTPFLSGLFESRRANGVNEKFADLVTKVINNSDLYTAATSRLIGIRHAASFAITEATDPSTVKWSF